LVSTQLFWCACLDICGRPTHLCGPISCRMSFLGIHQSLQRGKLFRNVSLVYGKPTCLKKVRHAWWLRCIGMVHSFWDIYRDFGMSTDISKLIPLFRDQYPSFGIRRRL
jgi:hypothetical protein